ncbi:hypothetical protein LCM20_09875 [Halobacillus litoralis]|nr:hypothetical protein [Halobacillus litoralis]MCA0970898.1 hypothetical protein [Halobacillus litoralis]
MKGFQNFNIAVTVIGLSAILFHLFSGGAFLLVDEVMMIVAAMFFLSV